MGVGGQRHALAALHPAKILGFYGTGGWVGSRAILDEYSKSGPPPGFNSQTTQPVVSHYTDCAIPAVHHLFRELGKKVCNSVTGDVFLILSLIRFIKMFLHVI